MKHLLITSFFGSILLFLASTYFAKKLVSKPNVEVYNNESHLFKNPLDQILGEKILEDGSLREDNFDSILTINSKYLLDSSELYSIKKLKEGLFLLNRKKYFADNRYYSLLVKTKSSKILAVFPFVDHTVIDGVIDNDSLYLLCGDYSEQPYHWKQDFMIHINTYDSKLNEIWSITTCENKGYFFKATGLTFENNKLLVSFDVQGVGSSTMCTRNYTVSFSKQGEFKKLMGFGGYPCGPGQIISQEEIKTFFTFYENSRI